jgi:hypothetical protein
MDHLLTLAGTVGELRDVWEATSFQIERLQATEACVNEEQAGLAKRTAPSWHLSFTPRSTPPEKLTAADKVHLRQCCDSCISCVKTSLCLRRRSLVLFRNIMQCAYLISPVILCKLEDFQSLHSLAQPSST